VSGPTARDGWVVSAGRRAGGTGGKPDPTGTPDRLRGSRVLARQRACGRDRIRTCVGNAGDFTGRTAVSWCVPSRPRLFPITARDVHKRPASSLRRPPASPPVWPRPPRPGVGRREGGGKSRQAVHRKWGLGRHSYHRDLNIQAGCPPMAPNGSVASVVDGLGDETSGMRTAHHSRRSIAPRPAFAGFRFPADVIALVVRWVPALPPVLPRCQGVVGRTGHRCRSRHGLSLVQRFMPLLVEAARPTSRLGP
jgi:hypothetical protein